MFEVNNRNKNIPINPLTPKINCDTDKLASPNNSVCSTTDLSVMPITNIKVNMPMPYKYTGKIKILGLEAETYKLDNGQKVVIMPKKGSTIVKTYVNVGSMNEPDHLRGISHYIEHNLFNGTENLKPNEFFKKVNSMGAMTNASTNFSTTDYYISSQLLNEMDLEEKIKLHADMLQNPSFDKDMLEKERGPVISEISMVLDNPQNIAANKAIKNLYHINTDSTDLVAGTINNIRNVKREDVVDYYNKYYTPDNYITVITGDVNPNETIGLVSKYFTKKACTNRPSRNHEKFNLITNSVRTDEVSPKATSSSIVMAFAGPQNNDTKGKVAVDLLCSIIAGNSNSKLKKELEPMHIVPDIQVEKIGNRQNDRQAILLNASCNPNKVDDYINVVYKKIFELQQGNLSPKDLKIAKQQFKVMLNEISEKSENLNNFIGYACLDKDYSYMSDYGKILENLTIDDVAKAAGEYLNLNKVSIAVVHPDSKSDTSAQKVVTFGSSTINDKVKVAYNLSDIQSYRLQNNLELSTYPTETDTASFLMKLKTDAPAAVKPGTAEILGVMLDKEFTKKIEAAIEKDGITFPEPAIIVTPEGISVGAKSDYTNADSSLALCKNILFNPSLSEETFKLAKDFLVEQYAQLSPSATDMAMAHQLSHLPFVANREDMLKSLKTISLNEVKGLYAYLMQNSGGYCVVSAPFEKHKELKNTFINELSLDVPMLKEYKSVNFKTYVPTTENQIIYKPIQKNQANVVKSYKFKTNRNIDDSAKFALLNIILGGSSNSRLFNDLREKQKLAYRVSSKITSYEDTGVMNLSIYTTTDNPEDGTDKFDNVKKSLDGFDKNTELMCNSTVTDEELKSAKLFLKTMILQNSETSMDKVGMIAKDKSSLYGVNYTNLLLQSIDKVTKEDIMAAANYIFKNPSVTSIVASPKTIEYYKNSK